MSAPSSAHRQATGPLGAGLPLPESLLASVQHIGLLQDKRRRLADALVGAELQFLVALRREYDAGHITWSQLRYAYTILAAGRLRGLQVRWIDAIGVSPDKVIANAEWEMMRAREVWKGHRPLRRGERYPPPGQWVVYVLFDANRHPIYVSGTNRCSQRMAAHQASTGVNRQGYSSWMAYGCVDCAESNKFETQFRRRYQPLNQQRARA